MQKVLVTGAAGGIGTRLRKLLKGVYTDIRWSDLAPPADLAPDETFVTADLAVLGEVERAVDGMQGIVHLGGFSVEGPWETILNANIIGCYNLFEAARRRGVERIVFASSNHAVGFYPRQRRIGIEAPVRPDSRYGVSKAFGEALGALYADIGLEHPDIRYEIFYGASDNARGWWDNGAAFRFGYRPQGRAEDHSAAALAADAALPPDPVGDWYQGGPFCSDEFAGGIERAPT